MKCGEAMQISGAQAVLEIIKENNIDTVFGYPGGAILPIYDALASGNYGIRHIRAAHEQGAAHAADGYARVSGKTGVVLATSGPGATNLVTALAAAQADSTPLVAITGNTVTDMIGHDSFQEVYIAGITMPITKHNFVVRSKSDLVPMLRRAFEIAHEGRCGAVLVDIPKNFLTDKISYTVARTKVKKALSPKKSDIKKLASLINNSQKPLIYFGGGVIAGNAHEELDRLCTSAQLPACHSLMGTGALSTSHSYNIGLAGMHGHPAVAKIINECDLLIAVGARFSDRVIFGGKSFANGAKRVHIDIDDAEISKSVSISLGICADAKQALAMLCEYITPVDRNAWHRRIAELKSKFNVAYPKRATLSPSDIISAVAKNAANDAIIVTDVGQHQMWTAQLYPFKLPKTFITSGGLGAMGFGLGAAIGAYFAGKSKQIFLITGDGSFHMNMNELSTAVRCNVPVKVIVMDNNALGMVRQWQHSFYDSHYTETTAAHTTDFAMLARAFGAQGYSANTADELDASLSDAISSNAPCVIHCKIDENEDVIPLLSENGGEQIIMR